VWGGGGGGAWRGGQGGGGGRGGGGGGGGGVWGSCADGGALKRGAVKTVEKGVQLRGEDGKKKSELSWERRGEVGTSGGPINHPLCEWGEACGKRAGAVIVGRSSFGRGKEWWRDAGVNRGNWGKSSGEDRSVCATKGIGKNK